MKETLSIKLASNLILLKESLNPVVDLAYSVVGHYLSSFRTPDVLRRSFLPITPLDVLHLLW